jgi:type I restriction enzyme M protein
MGKKHQTLDDDTAINVSVQIAHVWSIANTLRGTYKSDKYKDVIIPMIIIRRLECDLDPKTIDGHAMDYMFEDIIRRFSENAEAGDHYTPREVIKLLVNIILAEGCDDLLTTGKVATVLDMACGTGGMLSTTYNSLRSLNPKIDVRLFGQEINPESYAICLADMLIKGQDAANINFQDTMIKDCFPTRSMRIVITNPPFGTPWGGKDAAEGVESAVNAEHKKGKDGRFGAGLPTTGDMQLLFMQHAIAKMDDKEGRAAIISNGSPLFSGGTSSGESQIRRFMLENDLIEAIIALPTDLFYNTGIGIYAFILSKNKRKARRNKVQLINAVNQWKPLRKSLGKKRREISKDNTWAITELYANFTESKECKILDVKEFLYKEFAVYQPLQRNYAITKERIEKIIADGCLSSLYDTDKVSCDAILAKLEGAISKIVFKRKAEFLKIFEPLFDDLGASWKNLPNKKQSDTKEKTCFGLSEMDKTAEIQKDKNGNIIYDSTTKDTELIKLTLDVEEYFKREVYPHVPDAHYVYEYGDEGRLNTYPSKQGVGVLKKEKIGAEFPFTRYFYEYKEPEKSDVLLARFLELEKSVQEGIKGL